MSTGCERKCAVTIEPARRAGSLWVGSGRVWPRLGLIAVMLHPCLVLFGTFAAHSHKCTRRDLQKSLVFKRFSHFSRTRNVAFSRHFALSRAVGFPSLARTCDSKHPQPQRSYLIARPMRCTPWNGLPARSAVRLFAPNGQGSKSHPKKRIDNRGGFCSPQNSSSNDARQPFAAVHRSDRATATLALAFPQSTVWKWKTPCSSSLPSRIRRCDSLCRHRSKHYIIVSFILCVKCIRNKLTK
jgi:hypothetical protein